LTNPLQFMVFVSAFMTRKLSMRGAGSNDNYHHISATWQSSCTGAEAVLIMND
jgi:hypothetical protein